MLKFFLFPITHKSMFGTPENKGSPATKAAAAAVASLPEGFTIQVLDASRSTASVENVCSDSMCDIQPLEVAKISLQLDKANKFQNNMTLVMKDIMATRGWTGLFTGYFGIQYRCVMDTLCFYVGSRLKRFLA